MYQKILSDHRRSPLCSAASVAMLVAPDVDALCAARMLATLLKQDDVEYRIIPVSGRIELEKVAEELRSSPEVSSTTLNLD
jgi:cell division control protein 45